MLSVGVVGIGNCGNQIAALAKDECGCDVYCINSSENDLSTLPPDIPSKLIGDSEGSGKDRSTAKEFLKKNILNEIIADPDFQKFMSKKDVIFVASSTGGGTGSGMAPMFSEVIRQSFKNPDKSQKIIILIGVLPKLSEGYSTQVNSLDYLHELYDVLESPTYCLYDNNNYAKETSYLVLQKVNQEIIEDIKVLQCLYNNATVYDSIDEKDMKQIEDTPGRIVTVNLLGIKEKDLDEKTIEDLLIERLKKSAHTEIQRDRIVKRTGLITNLSDKLNASFDTHIESVRKFIGEATEEFLHTAVNSDKGMPNNVSLVIAGLSKINDRIDKIRDRIAEIEEDQDNADNQEGFEEIDDIDKMNSRRGYRKVDADGKDVDLQNIMGKF